MKTMMFAGAAVAVVSFMSAIPSAHAATIAGSTYQNSNSALRDCVNVEKSGIVNGTPVISFACSGGVMNEEWIFSFDGTVHGIGTTQDATTCLSVANHTTAAGGKVELDACTGSADQFWSVVSGAIMVQNTSMCLDRGHGRKLEQMTIEPCSNAASQSWTVQ